MMSSSAKNILDGARTGAADRRGYSRRRAEARQDAGLRAAARVVVPVDRSMEGWDLPASGKERRLALKVVLYGLAALALHGGVVVALLLAGAEDEKPVRVVERVFLRTVDLPAWPEKDEDEAKPEPVAEEQPAAEPEVAPVPRKKIRKKSKLETTADPVDLNRAPAPEPAQPRRRVVGISMESTVSAGAGPSFAVGNTRMGKTDERATEASQVGKLGSSAGKSGGGSAGPNTVASSLPVDGVKFKKPKRIGAARLQYPARLKAQGIDGDVVVLIRIDVVGTVSRVKVVKSSGYPEFDEAARQAAVKERYNPATRGGEPVEYSLKYTYRFRIKDA